uniref:Uncharacterized protein n=1 Tax=viral metagenome TaxID=1070528 RepID=A0A6H1Z9K3_9ZZZZ
MGRCGSPDEKDREDRWLDARDEWIKDQIEDLIRAVVGHLNDMQHCTRYYSYQEVREMVKRLI